ncbi:hypothetical protein QJS04_geneDACA014544 [Acorus gramineus]|uniref:Uncharacterized protein n=1 Tax=Acorus gramineus TaxID=55184 RepID=A0AAV9AQ38_ACOGR|nr:hypothetical protein QJS04_geneDACA014544 [Acorus gramineus]
MGSCFSSTTAVDTDPPTAKIVSLGGSLKEFSVPVEVSHALKGEEDGETCFLCSSDKLYYEECATEMRPDEFLEVGQIYFVLSDEYRSRVLTSSDMVALAVKASSAMEGDGTNMKNKKGRRRRRRGGRAAAAQVVPMVANDERFNGGGGFGEVLVDFEWSRKRRRRRTGGLKRCDYRVNLSTIYEGSVDD